MEEFKQIINIETGQSLVGLRELRKAYKDLQDQMVTANDEGFAEMSVQASMMKAELDRVNSTVTASGSHFTNFNSLLGRTAKSLITLDFGAAAGQAQQLQNVSKKLTFKEMTTGLKQAGTAMVQMGKAILGNPFLRLAAIAIAIGVALYKLMDEIGLLEVVLDSVGKAFEMLMIPINALIDGLKRLTDLFGWTNNAGKELAEEQIARNDELAESNKKLVQSVTDDFDYEIALRKARGEDTKDLELEKLKFLSDAAEEEVRIAQDTLKQLAINKGKESDEYKELMGSIEELEKAAKQSRRNLTLFNEREAAAERKQKEKDAAEELALIEKNEEEKLKAWRAAQLKKKQEEEKKAEDSAKFIEKINRQIDEKNLQNIEDEIERNRKLALQKIEWAKKDIDFKKLSAEAAAKWKQWEEDEIARIETEAEVKRIAQADKELENLANLQNQKKLYQLEQQVWEAQQIEDERERAIALDAAKRELLEEQHQQNLENLERRLDEGLILEEEFNFLREKSEAEHQKKLGSIRDEELINEKNRQEALDNLDKSIVASKAQAVGAISQIASANEKSAKMFALSQIATDFGVSLMSSIRSAQAAAAAAGPAAPAVFPAVLAQMLGPTLAAFSQAKQVLNSGSSSGGMAPSMAGSGGGMAPTVMSAPQPSFSNFTDDFAGNIGGGSETLGSTYIVDSELSSNDEKKKLLKMKKQF